MTPNPAAPPFAAAVIAVLAALVLAACGGGGGGESTSVGLPAGCQEAQVPAPKRVDLKPPGRKAGVRQSPVATIETSCGSFEIALDSKHSPKTVSSFVYLARRGVYDNTIFHAIDPNRIIQGGDPLGTGKGGAGYFVDEAPPSNAEYTKGTVAMAKTATEPPGRSRSQFFVVAAADAGLPPQYAILGRVSSGQGVVDRIATLGDPATQSGTPLATVVIRTITMREG